MEDLQKENLSSEREELIRAKEERFLKKEDDEEIVKSKPDNAFRKIFKSLDYFWLNDAPFLVGHSGLHLVFHTANHTIYRP